MVWLHNKKNFSENISLLIFRKWSDPQPYYPLNILCKHKWFRQAKYCNWFLLIKGTLDKEKFKVKQNNSFQISDKQVWNRIILIVGEENRLRVFRFFNRFWTSLTIFRIFTSFFKQIQETTDNRTSNRHNK